MNCYSENIKHTYGLHNNSVNCMKSYLTNRVQLCKTNSSFRESEKAPAAVPKSSILGSLLFNIFINDIFLILQECDLANYASNMYHVK